MKREKILMIHLLDWSSRRLSSRHFYISFSLSLFASIVTFNRHSLSKLILNVSKVNCTDTEMCVCVCVSICSTICDCDSKFSFCYEEINNSIH